MVSLGKEFQVSIILVQLEFIIIMKFSDWEINA